MEEVRINTKKIKRNRALVVQRAILLIFGCCIVLATSSIFAGQNKHVQDSRSLEQTFVVDSVLKTATNPPIETRKIEAGRGDKKEGRENIGDEGGSNNVPALPVLNDCGNSDEWLNAPRYGNLNDDPFLTESVARHMIAGIDNLLVPPEPETASNLESVLGQTICHKDSKFMNNTSTVAGAFDNKMVRVWATKLVYLALHYHQHHLAIPEARARYDDDTANQCRPSQLSKTHKVGVFDYECPDAKYIVMALSGNGLGANVRSAMVVGFLLGLASNRQVVFVNNANVNHKRLGSPWQLASCNRADYQCFYWPTTPCTLTDSEISNGFDLSPKYFRMLLKRNERPEDIEHHKVWIYQSHFMPMSKMPNYSVERLQGYIEKLIAAVPQLTHPSYVRLLREAASTISNDEARPGYNYAAANVKISHALTFYSVRPNPRSAHALDEVLDQIVPENFEPEKAVGLPIRGSDKCAGESECLTFDQHMQITTEMWGKHLNETGLSIPNPSVVFTTEAKSVVKEQEAFVENNMGQKYPYNYEFLSNTKDVHPDTGFIKEVTGKQEDDTADDIMLSSISTLKFQLLPRMSIGNCCSNFHIMLNDFLVEGCGAAEDNTFMCLQEAEDPLLRVCCGWHKDCKREKQKLLDKLAAQSKTRRR